MRMKKLSAKIVMGQKLIENLLLSLLKAMADLFLEHQGTVAVVVPEATALLAAINLIPVVFLNYLVNFS